MKDEDLKLYGVDKESIAKSGDIFPTLALGEFEHGTKIHAIVENEKPKTVEHKKKFLTEDERKSGKDIMTKTNVLNIFVTKIERPQDSGEFLDVEMNETFTLWLSSKSLGMGLGRIAQEHNGNLIDWNDYTDKHG